MTYGEFKQEIRDLGFEDDSSMEEYSTIVRNAANRSIQYIYSDIVIRFKTYFKQLLSTEDREWEALRPLPITVLTTDDFVIDLPEPLLVLVPLLAGHFVWLDDDVQKSVMYWNDYDEMKNGIVAGFLSDMKATIKGGIGW
jgi:hypothetical protein